MKKLQYVRLLLNINNFYDDVYNDCAICTETKKNRYKPLPRTKSNVTFQHPAGSEFFADVSFSQATNTRDTPRQDTPTTRNRDMKAVPNERQ